MVSHGGYFAVEQFSSWQLAKAIQELKSSTDAEISNLKSQNTALKQQNQEILTRLSALKHPK